MSKKEQTFEEKEKEIYTSLSELLTNIIEKFRITTKYAILVGQKRIMYIKGKELTIAFKKEENFNYIRNEIEKITKINIGKEPNEKSLQNFFEVFFQKKMLLKLKRIEGDKAKYPKHLNPPKRGENITTFEENCFYWVNILSEQSKKGFIYLALIIIILLLACLFPIWPLKAKIGFLWFILGILVFLLIFTILCLVVAIIGVIFGYDIVVIPNLIEPKLSLYDRLFNPFVAYWPREDDWSMKLCRFFLGFSILTLTVLGIKFPWVFQTSWNFFNEYFWKLYNLVLENFVNKYHNPVSVRNNNHYQNEFNDF